MKILEKYKKEIKKLIWNGKTYKDISVIYKVNPETVARLVRKFDYRHYNKNCFLTIKSEFDAYFLGLILADGSIFRSYNSNSYCLELSLKRQDKHIIESFRDKVCPSCKIYERINSFRFSIGSKEIAENLISYGIIPNKTYNKEFKFDFSKIPQDLKRHFIRGFFDGDGHFGTNNYTYKSKKTGIISKKRRLGRIGFTSSHKKFLLQIQKELSFLHKDFRLYTRDKFTNNLYINLTNKGKLKIFDYFYKNSKFFLKRKKETLRKYI